MKILLFFIVFLFLLQQNLAIGAITPSYCKIGNCRFIVTDCPSGVVRVYSTQDCSGIHQKQIIFTGSFDLNPSSPGDYYVKAFCDDGTTQSACYKLTVQAAELTTTTYQPLPRITTTYLTTTIISTTTTIKIKQPCPYECCEAEPNYQDKFCTGDKVCRNNKCVVLSETGEEKKSNYSVYIILAIILIVIGAAMYLILYLRSRTKEKAFEELYKKWERR